MEKEWEEKENKEKMIFIINKGEIYKDALKIGFELRYFKQCNASSICRALSFYL